MKKPGRLSPRPALFQQADKIGEKRPGATIERHE